LAVELVFEAHRDDVAWSGRTTVWLASSPTVTAITPTGTTAVTATGTTAVTAAATTISATTATVAATAAIITAFAWATITCAFARSTFTGCIAACLAATNRLAIGAEKTEAHLATIIDVVDTYLDLVAEI
jgi:hypothetical protein